MSGESSTPGIPDAYALRIIVGRWLRIRAEHVGKSVGIAGHAMRLSVAEQRNLLTQIAADAEHSDLLVRLFQGEEPLSFEEWLFQGEEPLSFEEWCER